MSPRPNLNDISSGRIAAADYAGKRAAARRDKAEGGDLFQASESTLAMPGHPERNEAEVVRAAELRAQEDADARRAVARYSMYRTHGCTGRRCRKRAHEADRELRDLFLEALLLQSYQPAVNPNYQWGRAGEEA